ncbi:AMP-binding protein [Amycolatopsis acidiphila]|uniref:AMP-binding protein n=1 Tax=Amycolatopsis acidiphila TaxID=715473 RepID=A0A557ZZJ9_9PSEU|nr:fatty acid--CoA ligase family protein [Amycolatopsis acidiphila]TVT17432.1 AMP-binding protein [Amycolatopsis acidiphila]UIJ57278.1 AMP-binding protein [Amycolatopsis acidiphila]GHG52314.1 o-succinylbenzoate--CoA ligase [Amycolatopsis acidiphila]
MGIRERLALLLREAPAEAKAVEHDAAWWSWGRLRETAAALVRELEAAGLGADTRIGIVVENRPEHVAALLAVLATGRTVVTVSPLQPAARMIADIERSALPVLIAGPEILARERMRDVAGLAVRLGPDGSVRALGGVPRAEHQVSPGIAVEMLTSGTTGPPKRVRLSVRQLDESLGSSGQSPKEGRLLSASASLVATPLVHIGGLWGVLACLYAGRRLVLMPRFELDPWVSAVERHQLRAAGLVPAALRSVLDADVAPARLASLQVVTSGTTACPAELAQEFFRRYGIRVLMTYGATEFAGAVAGWTLPLHEQWWEHKAGSAGRAFPGVQLRVTGADGAELPAGETGLLEVRAAQTAQGGREWVRTSDLARIDGDEFVWIVGRADDTIVRGGFKIQPETVKRALEAHPAVREAAVAGLPDTRLGAIPVAAVEVEPGSARPSADELMALCRKQLLPYEVPKHVVVVAALPRTPSTKVSRVELLELVRAAQALDEEVSQ